MLQADDVADVAANYPQVRSVVVLTADVVLLATMLWKGGSVMLTAEEYRQAEFGYSLAEMRRGFKIHAIVYALVMTGLIVLNSLLIAYTDADFPWVVFPLVGWGAGLALHYFFGYRRAGDEIHYRQGKVEEYAEKTRELV